MMIGSDPIFADLIDLGVGVQQLRNIVSTIVRVIEGRLVISIIY
jgi:hypothetical protein